MADDDRIKSTREHYDKVREALSKWVGATAFLWEYQLSLRVMTIRLQRSYVAGNIHLRCGATKHYAGPIGWDNANIQLFESEYEGLDALLLIDHEAEFSLVCNVIATEENVDPNYWKS